MQWTYYKLPQLQSAMIITNCNRTTSDLFVVVQFFPWFNFYFLSFLGMVMYGNEFETKENKNQTQGKIEQQHMGQPEFS